MNPKRIIVALTAGLAAFFYLPFVLGRPDGISESSMYGYSNRVALIVLVVFTAAFAFGTRGLGLSFPERCEGGNGLSRWPTPGAVSARPSTPRSGDSSTST